MTTSVKLIGHQPIVGLQAKRCSTLLESVGFVSRIAEVRAGVASTLDSSPLRRSVEQVVRPKTISGGMRKVGVVLVASPDPITDIPGVALLASSFVLKKREPANLNSLALETTRVMRDLRSLRL